MAGIATTCLIQPTDTIKTRCQRNAVGVREGVRQIYWEARSVGGGRLRAAAHFWTGTVSHALVVGTVFAVVQVEPNRG